MIPTRTEFGWGGYFRGRLYAYKRFGRISEYGRTDRLYCDYDTARRPPLASIWVLARLCGLSIRWVRFDRTRHGWHTVVQLSRRINPLAIVAAQAILGSDYRRESLNLMRCLSRPSRARECYWNILFDKKV